MHGTITWVQLLGQLRYDTIRDAILIYHMEPTTRKWKTEKLKTVKVWEIHVVSPEEEKERLRLEGFEEKEGFKPGMKEWEGDRKLIIISVTVRSINDRIRFRQFGQFRQHFRRGSGILQGWVSNPSEGGTPNYLDSRYRNQTIFLALEEIVGARQSYDI